MKKVIDIKAMSVQFTFEDGLEPVTLRLDDVTEANKDYAMLHGMAARIGDNAAIAKSKENNFIVTEAMRKAAVVELVEHYTSGSADWSPKARAKTAPQNATIAAIAAKRGCTYAEAEAWIAEKMLEELGA